MSARTRLLIGLGLLTVVTGCLEFGGDDGGGGCGTPPNGLAGKGNFVYECSGPADPHCDGAGSEPPSSSSTEPPPLPRGVARGARFRLTFVGPSSVVPISNRAVASNAGEFTALRTGGIGFVVIEGPEAVDAIRLDVVEAQQLEIEATDRNGFEGTTLSRGERRTFRAIGLRGPGGRQDRLAGTLPITWSVTPSGLADLRQHSDGTCELTARALGEIRLRAASDSAQEELTIRIEALPISDAGSDARDASDAARDAEGGDQ